MSQGRKLSVLDCTNFLSFFFRSHIITVFTFNSFNFSLTCKSRKTAEPVGTHAVLMVPFKSKMCVLVSIKVLLSPM